MALPKHLLGLQNGMPMYRRQADILVTKTNDSKSCAGSGEGRLTNIRVHHSNGCGQLLLKVHIRFSFERDQTMYIEMEGETRWAA